MKGRRFDAVRLNLFFTRPHRVHCQRENVHVPSYHPELVVLLNEEKGASRLKYRLWCAYNSIFQAAPA